MRYKVISFTSKLLSDLEMLQEKSSPDQAFIESLKEQITVFWNTELQEKTVPYEVYSNFLDKLTSHIDSQPNLGIHQNCHNILNNHRELIALQAKLPTARKSSSSTSTADDHRQLYNRYKNYGLLNKNLRKVISAAESKKLPFQALPALPDQRKLINLYPLVNFLDRLAPQYRAAAQWLVEHLQMLTFKELCASIKEACEALQPQLTSYPGYHVLTVTGKSQEWMANIALRYLCADHLPESYLSIGSDGCINNQMDNLANVLKNSPYKNFVMFDDVSYSGSQCVQLFMGIEKMVREGFTSPTPIHLHLVFGFISESSLKLILDVIEKSTLEQNNIHIQITCQHTFSDIKTLLNNEELDEEFKNTVLKVSMNDDFTIASQRFPRAVELFRRTTAITEWKKPDGYSTPACITTGYTFLHRFKDKKLKAIGNAETTLTYLEPVTDLHAPYRKKGM